MGLAVDEHGAHAADAFAAVVVKGNGFLALLDEVDVELVDHLQKGHVWANVGNGVGYRAASVLRAVLAPNFERQVHL